MTEDVFFTIDVSRMSGKVLRFEGSGLITWSLFDYRSRLFKNVLIRIYVLGSDFKMLFNTTSAK